MNRENGEIGDSGEPMPLQTWRSNLHKKFQYHLDRSVPHRLRRWLVTLGVAMIYILRVYWVKGFHVVSYGLATYVLNLLIGFLSPNVDPELEGLDGVSSPGRDSAEYKPFERRVPEFRFWYSITKAFIVSLLLTFISVLDVPVFWPILSSYWVFLFVLTMKRQIVHMIKYKYNPFRTAKPVRMLYCSDAGFSFSSCLLFSFHYASSSCLYLITYVSNWGLLIPMFLIGVLLFLLNPLQKYNGMKSSASSGPW